MKTINEISLSSSPLKELGEIADIVSGGTPKSNISEFWNGPIAWVTPKDLSNHSGKYICTTERTLTDLGLASSSAKILPKNSVLFSSRAPIGLVAINQVPMATNQGFKSFIPNENLNPDYLYWWLKYNRIRLNDLGSGATFKEISKSVISEVKIPLPPIDEQIQIAHLLDKIHANQDRQMQFVNVVNKFIRSVFLNMFNQKDYPVSRLEEVIKKETQVTYGIVQAGPEYDNGIPYIRTGDIKEGKIITQNLRHTSPDIAAKHTRSSVISGDIVMSIRATVGTTAVVPTKLEGANLSRGAARISPGSSVTMEYLLYYLRSKKCQDWISRQVKGATFREITLGRLRELEVPIPPISLQEYFSKIVKMTYQMLETSNKQGNDFQYLYHSLSQKAFRGKL